MKNNNHSYCLLPFILNGNNRKTGNTMKVIFFEHNPDNKSCVVEI